MYMWPSLEKSPYLQHKCGMEGGLSKDKSLKEKKHIVLTKIGEMASSESGLSTEGVRLSWDHCVYYANLHICLFWLTLEDVSVTD